MGWTMAHGSSLLLVDAFTHHRIAFDMRSFFLLTRRCTQ